MRIQIKHKLFSALLLTSAVVSVGMFLFVQWSFDRGFLNYVNSQNFEKLDQLSDRLTGRYAQYGDWSFLRGNFELWDQLLSASVEVGDPRDRVGRPEHFHPAPPPPGDPMQYRPRIALYDADKQRIFVPPGIDKNPQLRPIHYEGQVVGYLALLPIKELSDAGDLLFVEQQTETFTLVALAVAVLSLMLSFPLTIHLLRPVRELTGGTRKLIAGHFDTRIPVISRDELGQLSEDFNCLATTLEKNHQDRQKWVADISHELRTPLTILRGNIEALQDGVRTPTPQAFDALHGEARHLSRLIDDLYELSMSDIGALNYKKIKVDPVGILMGAVELYEQRFAQKGLTLDSRLPSASSGVLLADPDRLQQLFINLLENSLRYTDVPGRLEIHMEESKGGITFLFGDSAPGVPEKELGKLFDRLYRVEGSRNRAKGGTGLGMTICRNIVEAHQGDIVAGMSQLGGLEIKINLPLSS